MEWIRQGTRIFQSQTHDLIITQYTLNSPAAIKVAPATSGERLNTAKKSNILKQIRVLDQLKNVIVRYTTFVHLQKFCQEPEQNNRRRQLPGQGTCRGRQRCEWWHLLSVEPSCPSAAGETVRWQGVDIAGKNQLEITSLFLLAGFRWKKPVVKLDRLLFF